MGELILGMVLGYMTFSENGKRLMDKMAEEVKGRIAGGGCNGNCGVDSGKAIQPGAGKAKDRSSISQ